MYECIYTVLATIIGTHEISVQNVECLLEKKFSVTFLVYFQFIVDKEQQVIKQVYINLVIFSLFLKK